ncbi:MAG: hypothetical protein U0Z44_03195 [Kouleothrix sp.]
MSASPLPSCRSHRGWLRHPGQQRARCDRGKLTEAHRQGISRGRAGHQRLDVPIDTAVQRALTLDQSSGVLLLEVAPGGRRPARQPARRRHHPVDGRPHHRHGRSPAPGGSVAEGPQPLAREFPARRPPPPGCAGAA